MDSLKNKTMKAAVISGSDAKLQYTDFPEPAINNESEILITMKAAAIKNFDKGRAQGKHYSSGDNIKQAKIIGSDGVGLQPDGTRVYVIGFNGTAAEKVVVEKNMIVPVPTNLDDVTAAALPNAVFGSAMALRFKAGMKEGETVLINGATGFTGKIAVQIAKHYGAGRIIVTGRNEQSLKELLTLGADEIIQVQQNDEDFINQVKSIHSNTPIDIVLDYLWGHTAGLILAAFKGRGMFTHQTRFISIGSMAGDTIQLSAENLRSVDLQLSGSGVGSWTKSDIQQAFQVILPEMFKLAAGKELKVETINISLSEIEKAWDMNIPGGKRLVVLI